MLFSNVVLPAPFGPMIATISPSLVLKSMPCKISVSPYPACNFFTLSMSSSQICFHHFPVSPYLSRNSTRNDPPLVHHYDVVCNLQYKIYVMLNKKDCFAFPFKLKQRVPDGNPQSRSDASNWFI